jgi:hypothetical protein
MEKHNSLVDIYLTLIVKMYADIAAKHGLTSRQSRRDVKEIRHRVQHEGVSFLTKGLPRLGKAFDKALSLDTPLQVEGFELIPNTVIPKFLGGLLSKVFDSTGMLFPSIPACLVQDIRQLMYLLYKLEFPYEESTVQTVLSTFCAVEQELSTRDVFKSTPPPIYTVMLKKARSIVARLLCNFDHRDIIPSHGPGSVATGESVDEKSNFSYVDSHIESEFPFVDYFLFNMSHLADELAQYLSMSISSDATASVVLVPKDSRGPRLISKEPLNNQWVQQGILRKLVPFLERHELTGGHVNFTNQQVNRNLSLLHSMNGPLVTMDMKDASDRVSLSLVEYLFGDIPLLDALLATRTRRTRLPDGTLITLNKFAPMGSALCFPIEALVFFVMIVSYISITHRKSVKFSSRNVYVYGDDLVVPREDYAGITLFLESVHLKVNTSKCCVGSSFRESCGLDAFRGVEITPLKIRTLLSRRAKSASELSSYAKYVSSLYERGYIAAAKYLESVLTSKYGIIPYCHSKESSYIGIYRSDIDPYMANIAKGVHYRVDFDLQRWRIYGPTAVPVLKKTSNDGWREWLRRNNSGDHDSSIGTYAVPRRSRLKRGWNLV